MKKIYVDTKEELPRDAPKPRGKSVQLNCFVDLDHAGDRMTRCSPTGILIFGNSAPLFWYSKKKNLVESATFDAKFVALRIDTKLISSLHYKLQMFVISENEPATIFCDNEAVYRKSAFAESLLRRTPVHLLSFGKGGCNCRENNC